MIYYRGWVLVNKNDETIGIDMNSGGLPYSIPKFEIRGIHFWNNPLDAQKYLDSFKSGFLQYNKPIKVKRVQLEILDEE